MDLRDLLPAERGADDIVAARIRLATGGELPVLAIRDARLWEERSVVGIALRVLQVGLDDAADAESALRRMVALVGSMSGAFIDYLRAYDQFGRLPDRKDIERTWTALDLLQAVLEVHRASHPRSRRRASSERSSDERVAAAYELAAAEWGMVPGRLEAELTDEQLVMMLDAYADRSEAEQERAVEASRLGVIFARGKNGQRAYESWLRKAKRSIGATGSELEQKIAAFAYGAPEYVVRGRA